MTNHHTKLEDPWVISFLVINRTRFVYGDEPTCAKQYNTHTSSKGGIINWGQANKLIEGTYLLTRKMSMTTSAGSACKYFHFTINASELSSLVVQHILKENICSGVYEN